MEQIKTYSMPFVFSSGQEVSLVDIHSRYSHLNLKPPNYKRIRMCSQGYYVYPRLWRSRELRNPLFKECSRIHQVQPLNVWLAIDSVLSEFSNNWHLIALVAFCSYFFLFWMTGLREKEKALYVSRTNSIVNNRLPTRVY